MVYTRKKSTAKRGPTSQPLGGSPRRAPNNPYPKESDEMKALKPYLDLRFGEYGWEHVVNEQVFLSLLPRPLCFVVLKFLKAIGMKKGSLDIRIYMRPKRMYGESVLCYYSGMAIEMKRQKGGRISTEQMNWSNALENNGWKTAFCYGAQDAINKIEEVYGK
jgi:hypothetical protein